MEVITRDTEEVRAYFEALEEGMRYLDTVTAHFRPAMNGEVYLTGEDVCRLLHITPRTLQDYRTQRCNLQIFLCLFLEKLNMPQNTPVTKAS